MEFNMDALSVRWKPPNEDKWRGTYELSEKWKGKKVYVFVTMYRDGDSVECDILW